MQTHNTSKQPETITAAQAGLKRTWFQTERQYQFASLVQEAAGDVRFSEAFDAFLECAYCAMRQPVFKFQTGHIDPKTEERYLTVIRQMREPNKMGDALGSLVLALEEKAEDFLGSVYSCMAMNDKSCLGQCFTPPEVCELLARINLGDCKPDPMHRLTIGEPCSGGGAIVIAAAEHLKSRGFAPRDYFVRATDVSRSCYRMAYIQFALLWIPAVVVRGNSLTLEVFESALTPAGAMFPYRQEAARLLAA